MYKLLDAKIKDELVSRLVSQLGEKYLSLEARHFTSEGKNFFFSRPDRLILLRSIVLDLLKQCPDIEKQYDDVYVDHAFLLLKAPGGNSTPPHQDRPFWTSLEDDQNISMITFWFALEDIDEENGCLTVASKSSSSLDEFNSKNQNIYAHIDKGSSSGQFNFVIPKQDVDFVLNSIPMKKGSVLAFDAYEIHASSGNSKDQHRLSFKIVLRNKKGLVSLRNLRLPPILFLIKFYTEAFYRKILRS